MWHFQILKPNIGQKKLNHMIAQTSQDEIWMMKYPKWCNWSRLHHPDHDMYTIAVYPMKYGHGFVVLCFVVVISSGLGDFYDTFTHILQDYFTGTGAIALPQCQWSIPEEYG